MARGMPHFCEGGMQGQERQKVPGQEQEQKAQSPSSASSPRVQMRVPVPAQG